MGEIIQAVCRECGSKWDLRTGYGLLHGHKEAVKRGFPPNMERVLEGIYDNWEHVDFTFKQAVCNKCHNYIAAATILEGGKPWITGACPVCGGTGLKLSEEREKDICPRCEKGIIEIKKTGHWD